MAVLSTETNKAITHAKAWPAVLEMWLSTKDSERTRTEYAKVVEDAMVHLGDFDEITPEALAAHRGRLMARVQASTLSPSAAAVRLTALRGFLNFARVAGRSAIPQDALDVLLKRPPVDTRRPYLILDNDEIDALIAACENARDKTMLRLIVETGLRCSELVALRIDDFGTTETGILFLNVKHGKGNKSRTVPLSHKARECIEAYLSELGRALGRDRAILFESREGDGQLDTSRIRQIVIAARQRAGLAKRISPHSLRHTAAMRWLRSSSNLHAVGKLLGHASLDTTRRYVDHLELDELARVVEAAGR